MRKTYILTLNLIIISSVQKINILIKYKLLTRNKSYLFISELMIDNITEKMILILRAVLTDNLKVISFINFDF